MAVPPPSAIRLVLPVLALRLPVLLLSAVPAMAVLPMSVKDANGYSSKPDNALLCIRFVAKRYLVFGLTGFAIFTLLLRMVYFREHESIVETPFAGEEKESPRWPGMRLPPLYSQYHEYELRLPQHHWKAASHDAEPKFFFVPSHSRGTSHHAFHFRPGFGLSA